MNISAVSQKKDKRSDSDSYTNANASKTGMYRKAGAGGHGMFDGIKGVIGAHSRRYAPPAPAISEEKIRSMIDEKLLGIQTNIDTKLTEKFNQTDLVTEEAIKKIQEYFDAQKFKADQVTNEVTMDIHNMKLD